MLKREYIDVRFYYPGGRVEGNGASIQLEMQKDEGTAEQAAAAKQKLFSAIRELLTDFASDAWAIDVAPEAGSEPEPNEHGTRP